MKKIYFLTLVSALYATSALSSTPTCEQMPSCESLGYNDSASTCENSIGCPFDPTKVACIVRKYDPNKDCAIGDVYYANGTCGSIDDYDGSKTPIGVVFMLTDKAGNVVNTTTSNHGRIVSLNNVKLMTYSENCHTDILSTRFENNNVEDYLKDADRKESTSAFFSGKDDTAAIIAALPNEKTAAKVAYEYYPTESLKDDPYVGQYQWYLPSAGELVYLLSTPRPTFQSKKALGNSFPTRDLVESVLQKLGKSSILRYLFIVTTEQSGCRVWYPYLLDENPTYGNGQPYWHSNTATYAKYNVRPILAF